MSAEAFQQQRQRQRQRQLLTGAGYLTFSQTKMQFPRKGTGKRCIFFIRSGVNAALCTKANFSNRERTHSPLTPGCSFITQEQLSFWNKPLCLSSHLLLYDATLTSISTCMMFNDPGMRCDWLRDTQGFIRPETSQPYKNSKIKAEDL